MSQLTKKRNGMADAVAAVGVLRHGGIMTCYRCTAACRHCLYASAPDRTDDYITEAEARAVTDTLWRGGCRSVHIGGGEPFLDFEGLLRLVQIVTTKGIAVEYVETNAYWMVEEEEAAKRLQRLWEAGADTLCLSLDPFHAEYIPYQKPLQLAQLCEQTGMGYFLWQRRFLSALSGVDASKAHSRKKLEEQISARYLLDTAQSYGIRYGGRALNIEMEYAPRKPLTAWLRDEPCRNLLSTDHFHVDPRNRFIPPGCTGISLPLSEGMDGWPKGKYPAFEALYTKGLSGLYRYAQGLGFEPQAEGYTSACAVCFFICGWLAKNHPSPELDAEYYDAAMAWY